MEPRIQYATTSDGVSIAFWTLGKGMPFVHMPWFRMSHIQLEWQIPQYRDWYEGLAERRKLVRYDGRGIGLSDRNVADYSLDALVGDLEAVVDRLGLEKFALFGLLHTGPVAIAYAARRPERVSHLLLWCTYARGADYAQSTQIQAARGFMDKDWELYTETVASIRLGWSEGEPARRFAALMRESITPEALQASIDAFRELDVTPLLPQIRSPTLVLHRRGLSWLTVDIARGLASRIPDARLALLEGASGAPCLGDSASVLKVIDDFLGDGPRTSAKAVSPAAGGLVTVLFTDMEGSTTLTQRLGDARAQELLRTHNAIIRDALKAHAGSEIKHTGDGIMASFASASGALRCAIAIQRAFAGRSESLSVRPEPESLSVCPEPESLFVRPEPVEGQQAPAETEPVEVGARTQEPLRVRIGLNAGEPVAEDEDLFGSAVQLARRICDQAEPGQVLASDLVKGLAAGKGFRFADRGEVALKGFADPLRLYEVRWQDA